jgi:hypothetical protein
MENGRFELQNVAITLIWQLPSPKLQEQQIQKKSKKEKQNNSGPFVK